MKAITRPLSDVTDRVPDLNDIAAGDGTLFVRDGVGFAGRGVAARVAIEDATAVLAGIEHDSTVEGVTPRAVGSLPFEPGSDAELISPAITIGKPAGAVPWITIVDEAESRGFLELASPAPASAASFTVEPAQPVDEYLAAVEAARHAVRSGELTKAVIARPIT
ncbi:MAG: hypothetical protein ACR2O6_03980, partial [Ilumatobacteraceae bacterium]